MGTFIETANDKAPNMMPFVHFACNREHVHQSVEIVDRDNDPQIVQACCPVNFQLMSTKHGIRCLPHDSPTSEPAKSKSRLYASWCEPWKVHEASGTCIPPDRNLTSYRPVHTHDAMALDKVYLQ